MWSGTPTAPVSTPWPVTRLQYSMCRSLMMRAFWLLAMPAELSLCGNVNSDLVTCLPRELTYDLFTWPSLLLRQWWANSHRISVSDLKPVCLKNWTFNANLKSRSKSQLSLKSSRCSITKSQIPTITMVLCVHVFTSDCWIYRVVQKSRHPTLDGCLFLDHPVSELNLTKSLFKPVIICLFLQLQSTIWITVKLNCNLILPISALGPLTFSAHYLHRQHRPRTHGG